MARVGMFVVLAMVVGCSGASEPPSRQRPQELTSPDASSFDDSGTPAATLDPELAKIVGVLVEETCVSFECPDGRGCVGLRAFGIRPNVCFKAGKSARDIPCPTGTHLFAYPDGIPNWYCRAD